jgi:hypothetical protein
MTFCDPRCWRRSAGFTNFAFAKRGRPLPRGCEACREGSADSFPWGPCVPLEIVKLEQYCLPYAEHVNRDQRVCR